MTLLRILTLNSFFFALMLWAAPAWAADPDLIDVVEITNTNNPIIVHENILPGDSFTDIMTVKNLTPEVAYDIAMNLDIDTTKGIVWFPNYELEKKIFIKIEKLSNNSFLTLPGGGTETTLYDLDGETIALGSIPGGATEQYKVYAYFDINAGNEYQNTKVYFNLDIGVDILGESARLLLTKSNDSVSDETPGNEVVYTLEVTALGGDVNDVTLTDLPPEGFEYVGGSGEGAPFIHEYASPGVWDLGDMNEGETKTVSYKTKISESQDAGLYKDLAFAKGTSGVGTVVFANGEANPFVGTDVNVVINTEPTVMLDEDKEEEKKRKTKTVTQYVLGATLPLTGTSKGLLLGAIALVVAGTGVLLFARRRKGTIAGLLFLGMVSWGMPAVAEGATLSARIETPESVMQTQNFKIGFTTLDVMGRNLEVECYTTGSATPFAEYTLESSFGGNSGDCAVTSSVVPVDGDYEFFIRVNAFGENPETVESEHVLVTVATSAPGTPTNYDRDDDNCQAVITFTTANDGGKTTKVELYRSTENPFVANASTKVNEQTIGSNTAGSFTENLPGCDEDVFYALRAVAANGNGSGFVGDVDVDTETTTSTRTRVNTVTVPGQASGALPAASTTGEGAVEGVSTEASEEAEGSASGETGDVLGEMTEMNEEAAPQGNWWDMIKAHPWWSLSGLFVLLLLARYGYRRYTSRIKPEL